MNPSPQSDLLPLQNLSSIREFLIKLTFFSLLVLGLASALDQMISRGLRLTRFREFGEWNDILQGRINANLSVLGSSRAWVHVSPIILDSKLGTKSYNLGLDGYPFPMQQARYRVFRKYNKKPNEIIQIVGLSFLKDRPDLYRYYQFLPYLENQEIRKQVKSKKGLGWADLHLPLVRYFGLYRIITIGILEFFKIHHFDSHKERGYRGSNQKWGSKFATALKNNPDGMQNDIDPVVLKDLESFLQNSTSEGVQVYLVYAPEFHEVTRLIFNREEHLDAFRNLSDKTGVPFLDYSHHPLTLEKDLFYNSQHMNQEGAERFSNILADDILKIRKATKKPH
jgi:hypothetical protein